jgi:hypothetical protein
MEGYIPPKHRFTQDLHGTTSEKTAFFIVTTENIKSYAGLLRVSYPDCYTSLPMKVIATLDVRLDNGCILHSLKLWP